MHHHGKENGYKNPTWIRRSLNSERPLTPFLFKFQGSPEQIPNRKFCKMRWQVVGPLENYPMPCMIKGSRTILMAPRTAWKWWSTIGVARNFSCLHHDGEATEWSHALERTIQFGSMRVKQRGKNDDYCAKLMTAGFLSRLQITTRRKRSHQISGCIVNGLDQMATPNPFRGTLVLQEWGKLKSSEINFPSPCRMDAHTRKPVEL